MAKKHKSYYRRTPGWTRFERPEPQPHSNGCKCSACKKTAKVVALVQSRFLSPEHAVQPISAMQGESIPVTVTSTQNKGLVVQVKFDLRDKGSRWLQGSARKSTGGTRTGDLGSGASR